MNVRRACLAASLCLALAALAGACNLPGLGEQSPASAGPSRPLLAATWLHRHCHFPAAAFLPPPADRVVVPSPTLLPFTPQVSGDRWTEQSWLDYPGPVWPDIQVPPPTGILPQPEGQVNILLLGSDQRPYEGGFRTDTIVLLTINPATGTANMTSFPRDLYVYIPGWTVQRINTAFAYGGFDALALTFEYNFGVHPDHYVLINLWSFEDMIDSLGGLTVEVGRDLCDHRDNWGQYCASAGTRFMNGETALWYVRSRYSTSDFDRGRRQQEVIVAGLHQLISIDGIRRAPELYEIYRTLPYELRRCLALLPLAAHTKPPDPSFHHWLSGDSWVNYRGAQVLLPIRWLLEVMPGLNSHNPTVLTA
jgi:LCP family protein required for cell wall assembly